MHIYFLKSRVALNKVYVMGDFAEFIDKAVEEKIRPKLKERKFDIERLCCTVHFEGIRKEIVANNNLTVTEKKDREDVKKMLNS